MATLNETLTALAQVIGQSVGADIKALNESLAAHTHALATDASAGFLSAEGFAKLQDIADGATANATDAYLLNRANHTGAQAIASITGLQAALDAKQVAGSYAPLAHTHAAADVVSGTFADARIAASSITQHQAALAIAYGQLTGVPTTFTPAAHVHPIGQVTGLQTALDGKATIDHTHAIEDVTGLQGALDGKQPIDAQLTALASLSLTGNALNVIRVNGAGTGFELATVTAGSTSTAWGELTGLLSDQTDLKAALEAKADSIDLTTGLSGKEATITAGTTGDYWRGDKSWHTLDKAAVGLGNVDNTSDADKPVSTAQQAAFDLKADASTVGDMALVSANPNNSVVDVLNDLYATFADVLPRLSTVETDKVNDADYQLFVGATNDALSLKADIYGADFSGPISATNLSGTNTGDQDLSGLATTSAVDAKANLAGGNAFDASRQSFNNLSIIPAYYGGTLHFGYNPTDSSMARITAAEFTSEALRYYSPSHTFVSRDGGVTYLTLDAANATFTKNITATGGSSLNSLAPNGSSRAYFYAANGSAFFESYNGSVYEPVNLNGSVINIAPNGGTRLQVNTSGANVTGALSASGNVTGANLSGTNTGDQDLSGYATSSALSTGLAGKVNTSAVGANSGVASLDGSGKVPTSQLPALAITSVFAVASQTAQLALTAQEGDVAVRTDLSKSYIKNSGTAGTMADWQELLTPTDAVLSVNGQTGAVTITTITGNAGTATALATGRTIGMTGDVTWTSASFNGSGNVTGTSTIGANKVTLAQMAQVATGTFLGRTTAATGNVEALTAAQAKTLLALSKADVGLSNVDNTSDANKPVSTAQQTALNLKANLAGATFTGSISATNLSGTNTGDESSATILSKLAAASGGGTTNFLRADGTWAVPPTGGGSSSWGSITGTLSSQTDLNTALNARAKLDDNNVFTGVNTFQDWTQINYSTLYCGEIYGDSSQNVRLNGAMGDVRISANNRVTLTDNGTLRLSTTATGVDITGVLGVSGALSASNLSGTNTGDESSATILSKLAAASGGGTTNFLRADGTWAAPPSGGGTTANALTFDATGGAASGAIFDGSAAKTIDYSTVGAAAASHTHAQSDITGLISTLAAKAPLASPTFTGTVTLPTVTTTNDVTVSGTAWPTINLKSNTSGNSAGGGISWQNSAGTEYARLGDNSSSANYLSLNSNGLDLLLGTGFLFQSANAGYSAYHSLDAPTGQSAWTQWRLNGSWKFGAGYWSGNANLDATNGACDMVLGVDSAKVINSQVAGTTRLSVTGSGVSVTGNATISGTISASNFLTNVSAFCSGSPSASEVIAGSIAPVSYTMTAANCVAKATVAATASTVFTIAKDGTTVGTITFGVGSSTGTVSITSGAITANQNVTITAPASPDSTLANVSILLRA